MHPVQMNKFSWLQFPVLTTSLFPKIFSPTHASIFKWSKLLSPLTLTNYEQMEDIWFDEIKYSHPLWDELSETIFFKNIQ